MKYLLLLIVIFSNILFGASQVKVDNLSNELSTPMFYINTDAVADRITYFVKKNKNIQAIKVYDDLTNKVYLSYYKDGKFYKLLHKDVPKDIKLSDFVFHHNIMYDKDIIGRIEVYYYNKLNFSKKQINYIKKHPLILAHNESDWAPYNYNINKQPSGYSIDYMKLLSKVLDIDVNFLSGYTWGEYLELAKKDKIDLILNIVKNPQREKYLAYTKNPYLQIKDAIFTLDDSFYSSMEDLKGKKLAIIKGFFEYPIIKKYYPDINIVTVNGSKEGFKMLSFGKIDALIGDIQVGNYLISKYKFDNIKIGFDAPKKYFSSNLYIATNKQNQILKSILDKGMANIPEDDILKLNNKWFVNSTSHSNGFSLSKKEKNFLKHKKVIKMCTNLDWNPIEFVENGVPQGMSIDTIHLIGKMLSNNIKFQYVKTSSWKQSQEFLKDRKCDILPSAVKNTQRLKYADFTKPYMNYKMMIITNKSIDFLTSLDLYKDRVFARKKGSGIIPILKKQYPNIKIDETNTYKKMFDEVSSGKAFGIISTLPVSLYYIKQYGYDNLKISGTLDKVYHLSIAVRNDEPKLLAIFDRALKNISANQKQKIFDKWTSFKIVKKTDYTLITQIVLFLLFVISIIIYYNRKLSKAMKLAQESTRLKSTFLANMSHEIRTPMNGIIGMSHLLSNTNLDEKQKNYLEKIDISAKSLLGIINDILDFSKIEAGKMSIDKVDFDLFKTIDQIININEFKAKEKGLKIVSEYDKRLNQYVYGDSLRISQILTNLTTNAIKFTSKGDVTIKVIYLNTNRIRFDVIDNGIGLTKEQQQKLFQSFVQADGSITRKYGGTGLGLTISKKLVELMNGKIWVESEYGKGSTFSFEIELLQGDRNKIEQMHNTKDLEYHIKTLKGSKILVAEDNKINQDIILGLLKPSGIDIDLASDGIQAVDKFKQNSYELILMDLQMPNLDGYGATKLIREINKDIPIIALTANAMKEDIEKTKLAGMNKHLNKPIEVEKLYETLLEFISKKVDIDNIDKISKKDDIILPKFENLDIDKALKLVLGNHTIVLHTLKGILEYKDLKLDNLDSETLIRTAHTIKGISGAIGATKLQTISKEIEQTQDKSLFENFHNELDKVLTEISQKIDFQENQKINISEKEIKELFDKLKEAVLTKRAKNCKPIIEELERYNLTNDSAKLFNEVKDLVKKFKFKEAIQIL